MLIMHSPGLWCLVHNRVYVIFTPKSHMRAQFVEQHCRPLDDGTSPRVFAIYATNKL